MRARRHVHAARWAACLAPLAVAQWVGCGAFTSDAPPEGADGGSPDAAQVDGGQVDGLAPATDASLAPEAATPPRPCGAPSFCDDFEGPDGLPRAWNGRFTQHATHEVRSGVGSGASQGYLVTMPGSAPDVQQAFLRKDLIAKPGSAFATRVSFRANVAIQSGAVDGPRVFAELPGKARRDVYVTWKPGTLSVEWSGPTGPLATVPISAGWHTYLFEVDARPAEGAASFGHVRLTVDGAPAIDVPLGVDPTGATERSVLFGVSRAAANATGTVILDDAVVDDSIR